MENRKMTVSKDITKGIFGNPNSEFLKRDKWTSNEIKMYLNLIYNIQKSKNLNIKLSPSDFDKNLSHGNHFKYLNKILNGIQTKKIYVRIDKDKYRGYSLFSYLEYNRANDDIVVQFNKDLRDQIFEIKSFSKLDLDGMMELNSYYSLKTRLMLSGVDNKNEFTTDIKSFRRNFQIPDSYKAKDIQRQVLDVIKKENKEVVDIYFKKKGRSATHVIIKYDMKKLKDDSKIAAELNIFSDIILNEISKCKKNIYASRSWDSMVESKIKAIIKSDSEAFAIEILKDVYNNLQKEVSKSLVSYINGIIENKKCDDKPKVGKKEKLEKYIEKPKNINKSETSEELAKLKVRIIGVCIKGKIDKYSEVGNLQNIDQANEFITENNIEI